MLSACRPGQVSSSRQASRTGRPCAETVSLPKGIHGVGTVQTIPDVNCGNQEQEPVDLDRVVGPTSSPATKFRILGPIPCGQSQTAYRARDAAGRMVVLQKIRPTRDAASATEVLEGELDRYRTVEHVNLVSLYETQREDDALLISTEFVDGANLQGHLNRGQRFSVPKAVRIMLSIAEAVGTLHEAGLIHRAIRPATIMLTPYGRAKLQLPQFAVPASDDESWTGLATDVQSMEYMAPEHLESRAAADEKSDIYSLGATLCALITGAAPFAATDHADSLERKLHRRFTDPAALIPGLSAEIAILIRRSLDPDPQLRPSSVAAFVDGLQTALEGLGGYTLLEEIGSGNSAVLYRARSPQGQVVALKVLRDEASADERRLTRFYQEAKLALHIDHPQVIRVLEVGEEHGKHFIAMEHVEGENLARWTMRHQRLSEASALRIIEQIAEAVSHLHRQGIVHRDVNPANILIDRQGRAVLSDLGLSKRTDFDLGLTAVGTGLGTAVFAAPELFFDAKNAQANADIYGLGATLSSMLTGRRPFSTATLREMLLAKRRGSYSDPHDVCPSLTWQTTLLIRKAMRPVPARRPADDDFLKYVRICREACRIASRPAVRTHVLPHDTPSVWHVAFQSAEGTSCRTTATTEQVRRLVASGKLGLQTQVATREDGPYLPLHRIPGLCCPQGDFGEEGSKASAPFLATVLKRIPLPWKSLRRRSGAARPPQGSSPSGSKHTIERSYAAVVTVALVVVFGSLLSLV